jgi:sugar/nucleoside kinase (ribokinase family)
MKKLVPANSEHYLYHSITATGGIGSGILFSFHDDITLGRNESRTGQLLPYKDYCKQHIILHYIATLLDTNIFHVTPIGKVGNDDTGRNLLSMMEKAGMNIQHVSTTDEAATLFSVCFQYPDKSGGNITTSNSASSLVSCNDIDNYFLLDDENYKKGIVLSVPEVPLAPRIKILEWGRKKNQLNIASVMSSEVHEFLEMGGFKLTDILSVNIDEAARIANMQLEENDIQSIIDNCISVLKNENDSIRILITNGSDGVFVYIENQLTKFPSYKVNAISTAGAGDAFIAGTICGLCCGLPLAKKTDHNLTETAVELGILLATLSVTSADTIHGHANSQLLQSFAKELHIKFSEQFRKLFAQTSNAWK